MKGKIMSIIGESPPPNNEKIEKVVKKFKKMLGQRGDITSELFNNYPKIK